MSLTQTYSTCAAFCGAEWRSFLDSLNQSCPVEDVPDLLARFVAARGSSISLPPYIVELAALERDHALAAQINLPAATEIDGWTLNPSLILRQHAWQLAEFITRGVGQRPPPPAETPEICLVWKLPDSGEVRIRQADDEDLLALKVVSEGLSLGQAAAQGQTQTGVIRSVLRRATQHGLLLKPRSRLRRHFATSPSPRIPQKFLASSNFTLQWHITNACDLHCKHCYDRRRLSSLTREQGLSIIDDMARFCDAHWVRGHITFSGGNPFLFPHFFALYQAAADQGFDLSVLANPVDAKQLDALLAIQKPSYFQVSLEGLREHNDRIRGAGSFDAVMDFLRLCKDRDVDAGVMLTLTRDNMQQILPLADELAGLTQHFNFNRLSQVGEGAALALPETTEYESFLRSYVAALNDKPLLSIKDNLINIILDEQGRKPFGGCTGFGCGAAFNFVALTADGEVHACRKFPSPIGNIQQHSLAEIYDSAEAQRYRQGASACRDCRLRPVCGGCLAVSQGQGLDPFVDRDPFCFFAEAPASSAETGGGLTSTSRR